MNSTGLLRDLVTIVHEGGHAVHSIVSQDLAYVDMKSFPSEVAELASMSMELISMEHWQNFFDNADELKRAKKEHLEDVLTVLPWVATVDKFQHLLYTHPNHTVAERRQMWETTFSEFASTTVNWYGQENFKSILWQKQLHIFEVPFYYIEYGMAQLGAIAMWRNYKLNPEKTIEQYLAALRLGYTKTIGEIYEAAGVRFDFSPEYMKELMDFVNEELEKL
jgi:oligoendopeptidase F